MASSLLDDVGMGPGRLHVAPLTRSHRRRPLRLKPADGGLDARPSEDRSGAQVETGAAGRTRRRAAHATTATLLALAPRGLALRGRERRRRVHRRRLVARAD